MKANNYIRKALPFKPDGRSFTIPEVGKEYKSPFSLTCQGCGHYIHAHHARIVFDGKLVHRAKCESLVAPVDPLS